MEYIYIIIAYKVIQDFKGIGIAVKTDEQIFIPRIVITGFVQGGLCQNRPTGGSARRKRGLLWGVGSDCHALLPLPKSVPQRLRTATEPT
jgi:hypothetical protein